MNYISIGDMAQQFQLRQHNVQLKSTLNQLTKEVVSGEHSDVARALRGDLTALSGIDRSMKMIAAYEVVNAEAGLAADAMQTVLETMRTSADDTGATLLSAATTASAAMIETATGDAAVKFSSLVASLNANIGGRYLFGGAATDSAPLPPASEMLAQIETAISGITVASDIVAAVDDWFDAPAGTTGYRNDTYRGSEAPAGPFNIADGERLEIGVNATSPEVRDMLKGFALAALLGGGLADGDEAGRSILTQAAGERIVTGEGKLAGLQGKVGTIQGQIETARTRNSAESSALERARDKLVSIDPYESATALEAAKGQLETLYTLTSRLSGLSLVDYI